MESAPKPYVCRAAKLDPSETMQAVQSFTTFTLTASRRLPSRKRRPRLCSPRGHRQGACPFEATEDPMERRGFLKVAFGAAGAVAAFAVLPAEATTRMAPMPKLEPAMGEAPAAAIATPEDMADAKVENVYWRWRRRGWRHRRWGYRRWGYRRHWRRHWGWRRRRWWY
jgi:hypothetical protein